MAEVGYWDSLLLLLAVRANPDLACWHFASVKHSVGWKARMSCFNVLC
jgi:hypothetical protein